MVNKFRIVVASNSHWSRHLAAQLPPYLEIKSTPLHPDCLRQKGQTDGLVAHAFVLDFPGTREEVLNCWTANGWPSLLLRCHQPVLIITADVQGDERTSLESELKSTIREVTFRDSDANRSNMTSIEFSTSSVLSDSDLFSFLFARTPRKQLQHLHVDVITWWLATLLGVTEDAFGEPDDEQIFLQSVVNGVNTGLKLEPRATNDGNFVFKSANLPKCLRLAWMASAHRRQSPIKTYQDRLLWIGQCTNIPDDGRSFPQSDELCVLFFLGVLLGSSLPATGLPSVPSFEVKTTDAGATLIVAGALHAEMVATSSQGRRADFDLSSVGNSFRYVAERRAAVVSNPGKYQIVLDSATAAPSC